MARTPPEVHDVRPFIGAKDFDASRDFYVSLGWRMTYDSETLRVLELGDHRFYLQNYYEKNWCDNTMLHITVPDVDAWFSHVADVLANTEIPDVRMSDVIKDEGYGHVFHVWDPAGVLLHFARLK